MLASSSNQKEDVCKVFLFGTSEHFQSGNGKKHIKLDHEMNQFKHHESIKYNLSPSWPLLESLTVWISLVMILMDSVFLPSFFLSSTQSASRAMSLCTIFYQLNNFFNANFIFSSACKILKRIHSLGILLHCHPCSFWHRRQLLSSLHRLQNGSWIHIWVYQSSYLRFHSSPRHSSWRHHHPSASIWVWRRLSRQRPRDSSWQPWTFLPGFLWQSM